MMRLLGIIGACALLASIGQTVDASNSIKMVGLYAFRPSPENYTFWKACGYDTLQFIDHAFSEPKERHDAIYAGIQKGIKDAQKAGFKVYVIELSNIACYPNYSVYPSVYDPTDPVKMQERLQDIEIGIKKLSSADGFVFFGGDPGGSPVKLGPAGIKAWMEMGRKVEAMVKENAPKAKFNANIWAIAAWDDIYTSAFKVEFWEKEVQYGKMVLAEKDFISPYCGVEFPLHNYYRSLTFKSYEDARKTPEVFPVASDIKNLKSRGVKRFWGWAHFLIDEVDDGYTGYSGVKGHPAQAETRYLRRIVSDAQRIGLNGIYSNTDGSNTAIEAINTYAFAKFCKNPKLTPEQVIDDYAGFIADEGSVHDMAQVFRFIENHSTWESSIPPKYRIKSFDCDFKTADEALTALSHVVPNMEPGFPIPEPASKYIARLKIRLQDIAKM
ncbi:hypothetical protein [uncultured Desulfobulbus sp.]|uniref:hypothetical protein n=1 Tax=uncultured Desulfobulbus sp. TaxID=239745 RepID=UPI0029C681F9|nr:hypothetical protein [uncultured Desulfobulbus sp.]